MMPVIEEIAHRAIHGTTWADLLFVTLNLWVAQYAAWTALSAEAEHDAYWRGWNRRR